MNFLKSKLIIFLITTSIFAIFLLFLIPILSANSLIFPYSIHPFDIVKKFPKLWLYIKVTYCINLFINIFLITNSISVHFKYNKVNLKKTKYIPIVADCENNNSFNLLIGTNYINNDKIYVPEKGLYQNILVTGTIGSRKNKFCNVSIS